MEEVCLLYWMGYWEIAAWSTVYFSFDSLSLVCQSWLLFKEAKGLYSELVTEQTNSYCMCTHCSAPCITLKLFWCYSQRILGFIVQTVQGFRWFRASFDIAQTKVDKWEGLRNMHFGQILFLGNVFSTCSYLFSVKKESEQFQKRRLRLLFSPGAAIWMSAHCLNRDNIPCKYPIMPLFWSRH